MSHSNVVLSGCLGWTFLMTYSKARLNPKFTKDLVTGHF